jgi:hypothetical protein
VVQFFFAKICILISSTAATEYGSTLSYRFASSRPVRLAYQPTASSTFLSEQTSRHQPASSTFLSEQTSTSHQPPAKRTGCQFAISGAALDF